MELVTIRELLRILSMLTRAIEVALAAVTTLDQGNQVDGIGNRIPAAGDAGMRHRDSATVICGIGTEGISHVAEIIGTGQLA